MPHHGVGLYPVGDLYKQELSGKSPAAAAHVIFATRSPAGTKEASATFISKALLVIFSHLRPPRPRTSDGAVPALAR